MPHTVLMDTWFTQQPFDQVHWWIKGWMLLEMVKDTKQRYQSER